MSNRQAYRNLEAIEKIIDRLESVEQIVGDELFVRVIKPGLKMTDRRKKTMIKASKCK